MSRPPSLHIDLDTTPPLVSDSTQSQPRSNSLAPSPRRERPALRSSPLAGPSYASDGAGGIVQHESALDEEIARRKSLLVVDDNDLARAMEGLKFPSPPTLSRRNSSDSGTGENSSAGEHGVPRRKARPSFISLAPPHSPSHSQSTAHLPAPPQPQTLRGRHSSPNIARAASLDAPAPPTPDKAKNADWMTSAPTPSFSRSSIRTRGIVLPVKADSKSGQRMRRKSMPSAPRPHLHQAPVPVPPLPKLDPIPVSPPIVPGQGEIDARGQGQTLQPRKSTRSLRSVRSFGRMFRHEQEGKDVPPVPSRDKDVVPPVPSSPLPRSRASSSSGVSVQMPLTPPDSAVFVSTPSPRTAEMPKLSLDSHSPETREGNGKVKRLWAKVMSGMKKTK